MSDQFESLSQESEKPRLMSLDTLEFNDVLKTVLRRVYLMMTLGLLTTAGTAYIGSLPYFSNLIFSTPFLFLGLIIAELILVIVLTAALRHLSTLSAGSLFFFYAAINGVTLSAVFLTYTPGNIFVAFLITASLFGSMTIIGYSTRKNLDSWRGYLLVGLISMIILSVVNLFIGSSEVEWITSVVLIFIFLGLTIYDTQRIKKMISSSIQYGHTGMLSKLGIIGALSLYLDFVNLFLRIIRIFGRRRS
jgi:FtsH-binding integral membrane protein